MNRLDDAISSRLTSPDWAQSMSHQIFNEKKRRFRKKAGLIGGTFLLGMILGVSLFNQSILNRMISSDQSSVSWETQDMLSESSLTDTPSIWLDHL